MIKCPECGSTDQFKVVAIALGHAIVDSDGNMTRQPSDHEWEYGQNSGIECEECGNGALVRDFTVDVEPGHITGCVCADCSGADLTLGND